MMVAPRKLVQPAPAPVLPNGRAALFVGHPGHELRAHAWLGRVRPCVCVLTDGSGRTGVSRLPLTTAILAKAGAQPCAPYGRWTDAALYQALLDQRHELFLELVEELADLLVREQIQYLVSDSADGYNPSHDLCCVLADAAVMLVRSQTGERVRRCVIPLLEHGETVAVSGPRAGIPLELSEEELVHKLEAARSYFPLRWEIEHALARGGLAELRTEWFYPLVPDLGSHLRRDTRPFYEEHGERQVAGGQYERVVRFRTHLVPLMESLVGRICKPSYEGAGV